mmetsp:Transcript_3294/g.5468  ORF Transcript_3294/g.5468 Transcript_3294/m.5468 type:complete len:207 (-) Transcript_3294:380-1000(-)
MDTELIWCEATVELILKTPNRKDLLYIHYEGWNRKYDEYIYIDSHRLAPHGLYTSRQDIPKYRMSSHSHAGGPMSMMYAVVLQNAAEEARISELERRMQNESRNQADADDDDDDQEGENENEGEVEHHDEGQRNQARLNNPLRFNFDEDQRSTFAPPRREILLDRMLQGRDSFNLQLRGVFNRRATAPREQAEATSRTNPSMLFAN